MGGYVFCLGSCICCRRTFTFNPVAVPSLRVNGTREPVCGTCMATANKERRARGMPGLPVREDAYEPAPEEVLD